MSFWSLSPLTLTAQPQDEKLFIEGRDTFVGIPFMRAKILFREIADLSEYKRSADSLLAVRQETIDNARIKEGELKQGIALLELANGEKAFQYQSLELEMQRKKKIWRRRFLYGSAGGIAAGLLSGILISKL